ncbi:MAG: hypothetical protein P1U57_11780 [Oleibacter sp.]|nr:hypothetical protein [Thalassolituus sp.]
MSSFYMTARTSSLSTLKFSKVGFSRAEAGASRSKFVQAIFLLTGVLTFGLPTAYAEEPTNSDVMVEESNVPEAATAVVEKKNDQYPSDCPAIFHYTMKELHSTNMINLCSLTKGRTVLLVNTASHCGYTDQFNDLERIHQAFKDRGLVVIGVSSDSFNQEADDEAAAADVCYKNFGVSFTMLATVPVTGSNAHPLFVEVAKESAAPRWNFYKYLIDSEGKIVKYNSSKWIPNAKDIIPTLAM